MDAKSFPEVKGTLHQPEVDTEAVFELPRSRVGDPVMDIDELNRLTQAVLKARLNVDQPEFIERAEEQDLPDVIDFANLTSIQQWSLLRKDVDIASRLPSSIAPPINHIGQELLKYALSANLLPPGDLLSRLDESVHAFNLDYKTYIILDAYLSAFQSEAAETELLDVYRKLFPQDAYSVSEIHLPALQFLGIFPEYLEHITVTDNDGARVTDIDDLFDLCRAAFHEELAQPEFFEDFSDMKYAEYRCFGERDIAIESFTQFSGQPTYQLLQFMRDQFWHESQPKIKGLQLRQPISHEYLSEVPLSTKAGKYLFEIISSFPIQPSTIRQMRNGFIRAELYKTGSRTRVYMKVDEETVHIVFKNSGITPFSMATYNTAAEVLPGFVSHPHYHELDDELDGDAGEIGTHTNQGGFVEVYAGPHLGSIDLDCLPSKVATSILAQKLYITAKLSEHRIFHGHLHEGNFNVRFLLQAGDRKEIFFDVHAAIQYAIQNQMSLTPIVTLRDWDRGSSN